MTPAAGAVFRFRQKQKPARRLSPNATTLANSGPFLFGAVFLARLVVAQFAFGLAAQAIASRLLYAMGRDSALPKAVFGRLSENFHTPWRIWWLPARWA